MKKDTGVFINHILESIEKIEEFTRGVSKENFLKSAQLQDAVIRRLEIIGEAAKNVPIEFRKLLKDIKFPLDIFVYTPKEVKKFCNLKGSLINGIFNTGRVIYEQR